MIETGDIYLADLNAEALRPVLVLSNSRFTAASERALVAPRWLGPTTGLLRPWRVKVGDQVFAVDGLVSVATERLVERVGQAPFPAVLAARRALQAIT